jgi:hypothetical protein
MIRKNCISNTISCEKFNVIEMYNEDAECEAELDDGEFTTVKINEVL